MSMEAPPAATNGLASSAGTSVSAAPALQAALVYLASGLSVIPIRADGTKAPAVPWQVYQARLPTGSELHDWFGNGSGWGVGVVGGAVSGALEHLDFDGQADEVFPVWQQLVEGEAPGLVCRL